MCKITYEATKTDQMTFHQLVFRENTTAVKLSVFSHIETTHENSDQKRIHRLELKDGKPYTTDVIETCETVFIYTAGDDDIAGIPDVAFVIDQFTKFSKEKTPCIFIPVSSRLNVYGTDPNMYIRKQIQLPAGKFMVTSGGGKVVISNEYWPEITRVIGEFAAALRTLTETKHVVVKSNWLRQSDFDMIPEPIRPTLPTTLPRLFSPSPIGMSDVRKPGRTSEDTRAPESAPECVPEGVEEF